MKRPSFQEILSPNDLYLIREGLSGGCRTVSDIADRLSGPRRLSRVYAAVLRGHTLIDHRAPISEQSLLRLNRTRYLPEYEDPSGTFARLRLERVENPARTSAGAKQGSGATVLDFAGRAAELASAYRRVLNEANHAQFVLYRALNGA